MIYNICDFLAMATTVLGLLLAPRYYKWWIVYISSNIFFVIVTIHMHLPWMTLLGIILFFVGIKNYYDARNEKLSDLKCKNCGRVLPDKTFIVRGDCKWCALERKQLDEKACIVK